mmetsp:Transcript_11172/g.17857  ORF Transcript_11172/g.17857 Transcript_11172/m.17857 type:complete len:312 (+) Transcript_11172:53-988(+)
MASSQTIKLDVKQAKIAQKKGKKEPEKEEPGSPHPKEFYDGKWKYSNAPNVNQRMCVVTLTGLGYEKQHAVEASRKYEDSREAADYLTSAGCAPQDLPKGCSWVVEGRLIAGSLPSKEAAQQLASRLAVRVFINLMAEDEWKSYQQMDLDYETEAQNVTKVELTFDHSFAMNDFHADAKTLENAAKCIKRHLDSGRRVYVHCGSGIGRTGALTTTFLGQYCGLDTETSFQRAGEIYSERSATVKRIPETKEQLMAVKEVLFDPVKANDKHAQTIQKLFERPSDYNGEQIIDYAEFARNVKEYMDATDTENY